MPHLSEYFPIELTTNITHIHIMFIVSLESVSRMKSNIDVVPRQSFIMKILRFFTSFGLDVTALKEITALKND